MENNRVTCGYCGQSFSIYLTAPKCKKRKGKECDIRDLFKDIANNFH